MDDYELERWLLNGRAPKYKRRPSGEIRHETPIADPSTLDPYEALIYQMNSRLSLEQCRVLAFEWVMDGISYDDLAIWVAHGAVLWDRRTIDEFRSAGISPRLATREAMKFGKPTGRTFFAMVVTGEMTVADVKYVIQRSQRQHAR